MRVKAKKSLLGTMIALASAGMVESGMAQTGVIEEIVTTATRRSESTQDASVSIEVLGSEALQNAGVSTAVDLERLAPGLQVTMGGSSIQLYIRGAGDFSTTAYSEAAVAQNVDGVTAGRTQWTNGQFFDLQSVEILKGPQGTLYGRNAVGGAMNLNPVHPQLGENSGYISTGIQNFSGLSLEGAYNAAVSDQSAIRASIQTVNRDGYIDDGTNDDEHTSLRLQYLFDDGDKMRLRLFGNYQDFGGRGVGYVAYVPNGTPFGDPIIPSDPWTSINDSLKIQNEIFESLPPPIVPTFIDTNRVQQDIDSFIPVCRK